MAIHISIKARLILAFTVVSVLISGVLSILSYTSASTVLRAEVEKELLMSADALAEKYTAWLDVQFTGLETIAEDFDVNSNDPANTPHFNAHAARLGFNSMSPADLQGGLHLPTGVVVDASKRDYMQYMLKNQKRTISEPLPSFDDNGNITVFASLFTVPVFKNGVFTGGLVAQKDAMFLSETLKTVDFGEGSYNYILSPSGIPIAHTDDEEMKNQSNAIELAKEDKSYEPIAAVHRRMIAGGKAVEGYTKNGVSMVIAYTPIPELGWSVAVACPQALIFASLSQLLLRAVITFFVSLGASLIIAYFVGGGLSVPLNKLVLHFKNIASGEADLTQRLPASGAEEIVKLETGFNEFIEKLHVIILSLKQTQKSLDNIGAMLSDSSRESATSIEQILANIADMQESATKQELSSIDAESGIKSVVDGITELTTLIGKQVADSNETAAAIEEMVSNIGSVTVSVETMAKRFSELTKIAAEGKEKQDAVNTCVNEIALKSQLLQEANTVIAGISSQTNMLAMNAAIEAAHAGDAGKGFSVVADEIRKLSETSSEQTHQIGAQLDAITRSIASVVDASNQSASTFDSLALGIDDISTLVAHIAQAMNEQRTGSRQALDTLLTMTSLGANVKTQAAAMETATGRSLGSIQKLAEAASFIKSSLSKMNDGADGINDAVKRVSGLASETQGEIQKMEGEIGKFVV